MRLFTRFSLVTLTANLLIFVVANLAFYFSLRYVLIEQIDQDVKIEETEILAFVKKYNRLPENFPTAEQVVRFVPVTEVADRRFSTVALWDAAENRREDFRKLTFAITAQEQPYRVEIAKSLEATNNMLYSILSISFLTILAILIASALLNRSLLKRLWEPFYRSLEMMKKFRVSRSEQLLLPPTNTDEFRLMNQIMEDLAQVARYEFTAIKTFSENASHEIQTPISIIRAKLDLLLQEESLSEAGDKALHTAFASLDRLSRLNRSLLLLTKIENNQFADREPISVSQRLTRRLEDFQELWQAKQIHSSVFIQEATAHMHKELLDVLLTNLLANATIHNYTGGKIDVRLTSDSLVIKNTALHTALDETRLYQRFYKSKTSPQSNGLGLSIVKQICEASGFALRYNYKNETHQFKVVFSSEIQVNATD